MSKAEVLFGAADTFTVYVKGKAVGVVDRTTGSWRASAWMDRLPVFNASPSGPRTCKGDISIMPDKEKQVVFCLSQYPDGTPLVILGITRASFNEMLKDKTSEFD